MNSILRSVCCLKLEFIRDILELCQFMNPSIPHIKTAWQAGRLLFRKTPDVHKDATILHIFGSDSIFIFIFFSDRRTLKFFQV